MGLPKIKKPSDLREDLYSTLDKVCEGERYIIPTKTGEAMLISKNEYDLLNEELEMLKEFNGPISADELVDHEDVMRKVAEKFGFKYADQMVKKSRK